MSVVAIRETRFAVGLTKLAVACRQEADDLTLETYTEAMADQVDPDEWEEFVREAIRGRRYRWFPGTQQLGDDYDAWRVSKAPKRGELPIREDGQFWASGGQARHVQDTVARNPKAEREGTFHYIRRIAILSGLVMPTKGERVEGQMIHLSEDRSNRTLEDVRLPYKDSEDREPGEEG
jgi:hypothetical protein